jgi:hypothetical protein
MSASKLISQIPKEEITPTVAALLEIIQNLAEEIQGLKDEIAILKGQKPKPKIKPSNLYKKTDKPVKKRDSKSERKKKSKTKDLVIHEEQKLQSENLPPGSIFIDYKDFIVQDIIFASWNILYKRGRWKTPSGDYITAELPKHVTGHFGADLQSFVLYQHYGCHVTQPIITKQLQEIDVDISKGTINNILIHGKDNFHYEKEQILSTGLSLSSHINVDDTGARHKGNNGYCTHIGNEYFAWFESTHSKSRINFLKLLRTGYNDFIINDDALEYMQKRGLPKFQLEKLKSEKRYKTEKQWMKFLKSVKILTDHHVRIATEGGLVGSIIHNGYNKDMVIISDDAGQFNIFLHGLCWVHAERTIHKLIGFTEQHTELLKDTRTDIWNLYRELKDYRINPDESKKNALEKQFDELFTRKTKWASLDLALKRIHDNKTELLLVLDRPDIPLHNNLSENDIREYVKRRKISGSTRSDTGRRCRDSFTSLKKTCRKLNISFWDYLTDRIYKKNKIPPLCEVMAFKMTESAESIYPSHH